MMTRLPWHINGKLHVSGRSRFIGDEAALQGMLHAKFFFSPIAHARLISLDTSAAKAFPGVHAVLSAKDIPGANMIGHVIKDEPLFPDNEIMYLYQPLAMVLAEDESIAEAAASLIIAGYEELEPILDIETAEARKEWYIPERTIESGDVHTALSQSEYCLSGCSYSGGQEHFYMESQRVRAVPTDHELIHLFCATQSTMEVQEVVSVVLGIPAHRIVVEVPRLGGAFGGKERGATIWATMAALGAYLTGKPVQVLLTRDEDMHATGKRHPFKSNWQVGFDASGRIQAWDVELMCNGGAYADLSIAILERAMFHAENIYHIPNTRIRGRACRTNLPPNTAFRGFGGPQGIFVIETVIEEIAAKLGKDPLEIRKLNAYRNNDKTAYGQTINEASAGNILDMLADRSMYREIRQQIELFNAENRLLKQGLGIMPVKFGISFTTAFLNQGSALIWIYIDGSVSVSTGGVEMGQELNSKVAMVVARVLGLPFEQIRVESSHSQRTGNASPTAASTGSDINGNAARIAAERLISNLYPIAIAILKERYNIEPQELVFRDGMIYAQENEEWAITFKEMVQRAHLERVSLGSYGYYATPNLYFDRDMGKGQPFHYYVYGAAIARVELNTLSGEHRLLSTHIIHECGQSLHPEIDKGQVMGAFIQGMGWCTMEELVVDDKGQYLSGNPSTYKIPGIRDLPETIDVQLIPSQSKEASVFGSKAVGEPPLIYGMAVFFALKNAIRACKPKADLCFPATPEAIIKALN
ncbi:MAG: molybdopterin cofactor-binding domain-containing protein [Candidatus Cloacimonadaceae bacterium]|jgi:xanthine dehydrogenase large subunit|nr:molybdopterin-dependent oxidoreductase [Candidatus Cloacimonadota bacterium]